MRMVAGLVRHKLLRLCEAERSALRRREDPYDSSTEEIREGIESAERIIKKFELRSGPSDYLQALESELMGEQGRFDSAGLREDNRTTAGVATVRNLIPVVRRWLLRQYLTAFLLACGALFLVWRFLIRA